MPRLHRQARVLRECLRPTIEAAKEGAAVAQKAKGVYESGDGEELLGFSVVLQQLRETADMLESIAAGKPLQPKSFVTRDDTGQ